LTPVFARKSLAAKIIGSCDDSEDVRIEIHRADHALARTRIKEDAMACYDGASGSWAGVDIHRQWGCQQDVLVFIEFEQVGALKVIVAHTIGQAKGICKRDGQLDEHATGGQGCFTLPPMDVAVAGSAVASSSNATRIPNLFMLDPPKFEMTTHRE
jgi:hypothetical protein